MLKVYVFLCISNVVLAQNLGAFQEVFAWKQVTYDINGIQLLQDRYGDVENERMKRETDRLVFSTVEEQNSNQGSVTTPPDTNADANKFFIQYNNVPMGAEKVGHRLFVAFPRRRYGIPATLNYIDLNDQNGRSPALKPYPNIYSGRSLISVYRTRADTCGRLWMVDTGLLELPVAVNRRQLQPPAIVVFDLKTDQEIFRYTFKESDIPSASTPTGLASITVDITNNCADAYAYVPDLTTNGIIVYSLRDNDSWRITHNYFNFNPLSENLRVSGEYFQWSDGIFSIALSPAGSGCRTAYFHPLISTQEFSISTCLLQNRTASSDRYFFDKLTYLGDRGSNSQSTMHDFYEPSRVLFFADIGRDAISCWNTERKLEPQNVAILAQDSERLSYPSDLHITDNEVWVIANKLPRFGYSSLDTNQYNFYIYKANVRDLLSGTVCE
ncbi:unnamed protein product [Pieris brassicae]|uniref:Uncharacterized protein n=1 Tax=Pieris brassicae TaxID=7116 RepID=A0A9P0TJ70_PIEBR|nr:unnamed protein product [Pieris brassicae]